MSKSKDTVQRKDPIIPLVKPQPQEPVIGAFLLQLDNEKQTSLIGGTEITESNIKRVVELLNGGPLFFVVRQTKEAGKTVFIKNGPPPLSFNDETATFKKLSDGEQWEFVRTYEYCLFTEATPDDIDALVDWAQSATNGGTI